jgi:phosphoribosyl 1,2-cyclic phosphodiesterase
MPERSSLRAVFLASGSAGNATAVTTGDSTVLIDCGMSAREISRRLAQAGLDAGRVRAVLVTHEHSDHVRGLEVFVRRHAPGCVVYASAGTRRAAHLDELEADVRTLEAGTTMRLADDLSVLAFSTSHDSVEPLGFRFDSSGSSIGLATDTGIFTPECEEALRDVEVLGIESNHDLQMLDCGPYPPFLKRRIRSDRGHLSNVDAARAVELLASNTLRAVIGLHRSQTNNTAALAGAALQACLDRLSHPARVMVAAQHVICDTCTPQATLFDAELRT